MAGLFRDSEGSVENRWIHEQGWKIVDPPVKKVKPLFPQKEGQPGQTLKDIKTTVALYLKLFKTGARVTEGEGEIMRR